MTWPHPRTRTPAPGVVKQIMYIHYMAMPYRKNPCLGDHESYNFGRPSLVIITIYLVCLIYAWE